MKTRKAAILLILFLGHIMPNAFPQDISTEGTDFWVAFLGNGFDTNTNGGNKYLKTQVLISSLQACSGVISNPYSGWSRQFEIEDNSVIFIDIPREQAYMECDEYGVALSKSLHILTDHPVSAYCANAARYSFDASFVLPTPALADDYIIQTYDQSKSTEEHTSAFLIIAVEEGETTVDITPAVTTLDGRPANQQYSITLQQGQVYQVRSNHSLSFYGSNRDLSGSRVIARDCKKIAVFNGSTLTKVPTDGEDSDCIFEQAMPLQAWGKQFVVTASLGRQNKDYVKITSASDTTEITVNGQHHTTLNANESVSFQMEETSYFIEASSRCAVFLYNHSKDGSSSTSIGAPSMVWIAPIEQRINNLAFNTFNDDEPGHVSVDRHFVNIIVERSATDNVILDGIPIPENQFETVAGNSNYMFYRQEISHGAHYLSCLGGFNAHVYGFGNATGYAYMVGSKAADLTTSITINEVPINPHDTVPDCALEDISFLANINLNDYTLVWDFGDGNTSNNNPTTHRYANNGLYEVSLTITTEETPCGGSSTSNTYYFYIDSRHDEDIEIFDTICFRHPDTYTEHDFNLYYETPGHYNSTHTVINENGCQSLVMLDLTVNGFGDAEPDTVVDQCNSYDWYEHTYTESGQYTDTLTDSTGCYSVHHLKLELAYTPDPTEIYPTDTTNHAPHWVVTATEFQINSYEFKIKEDSHPYPLCKWDSIKWHFEDPNIQWILEPDTTTLPTPRMKCRMYVLNYIEDTVWLVTTVYNKCSEDNQGNNPGISRRYWFVCSFYGLEENDSMTSPKNFDVDIAPNPNNGEMDIITHHLKETVEVKVYDMTGQCIDQFALSATHGNHYHYMINQYHSGIYFMLFNHQEKIIAKKLIITK